MKRIIAKLSFMTVAIALLAGCGVTASGSSGTDEFEYTDASIATYCGDEATAALAYIAPAINAKPDSGQRNALAKMGIEDPTDDKKLASIEDQLAEQAKTEDCTASTVADTELSDDERNAIIEALSVSTIPDSAVCKTDEYGNVAYAIDSLLGVPPRLWPAAISTPITASDPAKARLELQTAICKDPNLGVAWLTFMATEVRDEVLAATDIDLLVLNPRLKEYTDVSQITPTATTFVPLLNIVKPTTEDVVDAVEQNAAWQQEAALVNTLLERFAAIGIDARQSIVNYRLIDFSLDADVIPKVGISDKQENLPALIFALTEKGQCGELVAFGANVGDKRPELFKATDCKTTTTPNCVVTATNSCTTYTWTCEDTNDCGTTQTCPPGWDGTYPVCKGPSTEDPTANGNANTGGGRNATPGSGAYIPPAETTQPPATPYVPPVRETTPAPEQTPDPAPAPEPEQSAPPASNCSPAPGRTC